MRFMVKKKKPQKNKKPSRQFGAWQQELKEIRKTKQGKSLHLFSSKIKILYVVHIFHLIGFFIISSLLTDLRSTVIGS